MIIPLMDGHHANYYTREVMVILIREFSTPDEEMKKVVFFFSNGLKPVFSLCCVSTFMCKPADCFESYQAVCHDGGR